MIPQLKHIDATQRIYLDFFNALRETTFRGEIAIDYANRTVLATDNSVYQRLPQGVVYPQNTDDIVILTQLITEPRFRTVSLAARGGGTGTNAQSLTDGIVVDTSRHMNSILEINEEQGWVRVQCGVVKDQLNAALKPLGLFFAPELSTSNRATIGGMINTDASGQGSCLYGKTRDHVLELQTVLADGSVLHSEALSEEEFNSLSEQQNRTGLVHRLTDVIYKENHDLIQRQFPKLNRCLTGYDLAHIRDDNGRFNLNNILCGSEGTLGFITEAKLNVLPIPKFSSLVIVKYENFEASLRDASQLMATAPTSIETIDSKVLTLAMNDFIWSQVEDFFDTDTNETPIQGINLVEFAADDEHLLQEKLQGIQKLLESSDGQDRAGYAIVEGSTAVNKIWAMRKRAVGLLGNVQGEARPIPFVEDTAVPPEHLADFIMEFRAILDSYKLQYGMFGHVDAGVLHVRPALDLKDPDQEKLAWEISDKVAALTKKYHGLLWGEHGKGVRSEYAPEFFGELYPQLQRIKAAFDPHNQLNPGKIATPDQQHNLLSIREVTTRGELDRQIHTESWNHFEEAVYCNGNGACHNWNFNDAMCPSWKGTRKRTHTPKGRASLIREWLRLIDKENKSNKSLASTYTRAERGLINFSIKLKNTWKKKYEYDFSHEVYESMSACLACKSCSGQCPVKVDVPEFRSKFLSLYHTRYSRPLKDYLVGSLETILPIFASTPWLYNIAINNPVSRFTLKKLVGFCDGPSMSKASTGLKRYKVATPKNIHQLDEKDKARSVVIVLDAFTRFFETPLVADCCELLETLGFNVLLTPYGANGKPLHVHGFLRQFKKTASRNAAKLRQIEDSGLPLIGVDPSMTLVYRHEYLKYMDPSKAPKVALIQEWLVDNLPNQQSKKIRINDHFYLLPHCTESTNASGATKKWQQLFSRFNAKLTVVNVGCCGMAGTFGHEQKNRGLSKTIFDQSWRQALDKETNGKKFLATGYSCRTQAQREMHLSIEHPAQALLKAIKAQ